MFAEPKNVQASCDSRLVQTYLMMFLSENLIEDGVRPLFRSLRLPARGFRDVAACEKRPFHAFMACGRSSQSRDSNSDACSTARRASNCA